MTDTTHGQPATILVFGGTGRTGRHLVRLALNAGHHVRVVARGSAEPLGEHPRLEIRPGTITDPDLPLDPLLAGIDAVVAMLGDARAQAERQVNAAFVRALIPAMRRSGTRRLLYQAGGLSAAPGERLPFALRVVRSTIARRYGGQHADNEAVMQYLASEALDLDWAVHRAGIGSDGPSKGVLQRSAKRTSIAPFVDCAEYNLRTLFDQTAVHTCDTSSYRGHGAGE